jgi:hypothetical protein
MLCGCLTDLEAREVLDGPSLHCPHHHRALVWPSWLTPLTEHHEHALCPVHAVYEGGEGPSTTAETPHAVTVTPRAARTHHHAPLHHRWRLHRLRPSLPRASGSGWPSWHTPTLA